MLRLALLAAVALSLAGCGSNNSTGTQANVPTGPWRAVVLTQGREIPFLLDLQRPTDSTYQFTIINGEERIILDPATLHGDSLVVPIDVFDASLFLQVRGNELLGHWVKNYLPDYRLAVRAVAGDTARFAAAGNMPPYFGGRYAVTFKDTAGKESPAVGVFKQNGTRVTGTFLTTTGDYRYLAGVADGDSLRLSTFNGEWAYLFAAGRTPEGLLQGTLVSGKSGFKTWTAKPDSLASLPNPNSLTYLKKGYPGISFSFPGVDGKPISLADAKYQGKPVIIQIFGTWCPNCRDETVFLADYYKRNKARGVEIIALAFERNADPAYATGRIQKLRQKLGADYDFAIAGTSTTEAASAALPQLNAVISFPTTIILDKLGRVRKIHTGFSGPGTGPEYAAFVADFNQTMEQLLAE